MHGTGRTRAGAGARFRAPLRRGPAPPGENAAQSRDAAGRRPGEPGSRVAALSLRPFSGHANALGATEPRGEGAREHGTHSARLSALTANESQLRGEARVRGARRTRSSHPRALPARSGQPQRGRVLREQEEAWPCRDEPMGSGVVPGGGAQDPGADWPDRPPVCRCGGSHVPGAGTTSCWRPTRGGAGGASAASGWSGGRGVLVS